MAKSFTTYALLLAADEGDFKDLGVSVGPLLPLAKMSAKLGKLLSSGDVGAAVNPITDLNLEATTVMNDLKNKGYCT